MAVETYDIVVKQGATYQAVVTWTDSTGTLVNVTGYSARMKARTTYTDTTPLLSITSASEIVLGGAAGTITITIAATVTAAYLAGEYVYDLELVSGAGVVYRLLEGQLTVAPEVTY